MSRLSARRLVSPFVEFFRIETSGGLVLMGVTILALILANSPLSEGYHHVLESKIGTHSIHYWVNDGLMAIFFFLVGLEIKREVLAGELRKPAAAALPIAGAIGGMLVPALIYALFNHGQPGARGWGVPMATDIAFSLGVLALLGPRIPLGLKIFLTALAIVDDLGAVMIIAIFYSESISIQHLIFAGGTLAILFALNRLRVRRVIPYLIAGPILWYFVAQSGIHATVAGVLLALPVPVTRLHRIERALHPWVTFGIIPLFALSNAGLALSADTLRDLQSSSALGAGLGLLIGKPLGIFVCALIAIKLRWATLPEKVNLPQLLGVGFLGGIGFTMSLFVADLAFGAGPLLEIAKIAVLVASVLAAIIGSLIIARSTHNGETV